MTVQKSILLLGAGNMGGALLAGWTHKGELNPLTSAVIDPNPSDRVLSICEERGIRLNPVDDGDGYDIAILAVKPQMFPDVLPTLAWTRIDKTVFASIAAGVTIDAMKKFFAASVPDAKIVRTMPNLPSAVGQGVTLLVAAADVVAPQRDAVASLFAAVGTAHWCADEDELDRLMGVSGCGPAFVFLLAEALEEAAHENGASAHEARIIAEMTLTGSALHLSKDGRAAGDLRRAVTSPGGTTAAGLSVLDDPESGFRPLMKKAVASAYARAKDLAR